MSPGLFLKDELLDGSPPIVGYQIMLELRKNGGSEISLFDLAHHLQKRRWYSPKHLYLGMIFLYSMGAIEFNAPYIKSNVQA